MAATCLNDQIAIAPTSERAMLNCRRVLLGGTALAAAAAVSNVSLAISAHSDSPVSDEVTGWLRANAIPLATVEPGSGFDDLAPLRDLIGNARIVSLGEATHGTREFFQLKHRLIEYCVANIGRARVAPGAAERSGSAAVCPGDLARRRRRLPEILYVSRPEHGGQRARPARCGRSERESAAVGS